MDLDGTTTDYDWKIFYNDGTNIYIIAEDCVPMANSLMPTITGRTENSSNPYSLYLILMAKKSLHLVELNHMIYKMEY